jgi:hypothetical protein
MGKHRHLTPKPGSDTTTMDVQKTKAWLNEILVKKDVAGQRVISHLTEDRIRKLLALCNTETET